jgi:pyridoxine 5-phosphate synthase
VGRDEHRLAAGIARLNRAGIRTSLFIDPDEDAVRRSHALGARAIELHTGTYANRPGDPAPLAALARAAELGASLGLAVHAGHGLTVSNVGPVAAIAACEELNIGHSIVSRAVFVGLAAAVTEMRQAMDAARRSA